MKMIYIYCEGQTEESFINNVLAPYLSNIEIYAMPIICTTSRKGGKKFKGGVSDYSKIKNELSIICKQHKNEMVTTMFDYYAMPSNTPGIDNAEVDLYKRISEIEETIVRDISCGNLFFHFNVHEFEGLLYAEPNAFSEIADETVVAAIARDRDEANNPEYINNSFETAPSKRLERLMPDYAKVKNGTIVSQNIGIDKIMAECPHFSAWVEKIKSC